jgi:fluoride ion exporter CrcB/FEX
MKALLLVGIGEMLAAISYASLSVILGLAAAWLGLRIVQA